MPLSGILERVFRAMSDAQQVNDSCSVLNQAHAPGSVKIPQESSKRRQTTTNSCKECENEISKSSRNQLCKTCYQRNYKRNKVNKVACETETILSADDDVDSRVTPDIPCIERNIEAPHLQKRRRSASEAVIAACSKAEETEAYTNLLQTLISGADLIPFAIIDSSGSEINALSSAKNLSRLMMNEQEKPVKFSLCAPDITTIEKVIRPPENDIPLTHPLMEDENYVEIDKTTLQLLNEDWVLKPQLRYSTTELLAGALLVENDQVLHLNCVEAYARLPTLDAHHERFSARKGVDLRQNSLPIYRNSRYNNLTIATIFSDNARKLVIGTHVANYLVVSSTRLDQNNSSDIGASNTIFRSSSRTKVYLSKQSIANSIKLTQSTSNRLYSFDVLSQLRQVRSKFDRKSTYLLCRSSSQLTNNLACRPATIWTLADFDGATNDDILASRLFQTVALSVLTKNGQVTKHGLLVLLHACNSKSKITDKLTAILEFFEDEQDMSVIGNVNLNKILKDMAEMLSSGISKANVGIQKHVIQRYQELDG